MLRRKIYKPKHFDWFTIGLVVGGVLVLLFSGCAAAPQRTITRYELPLSELQKICGQKGEPVGCALYGAGTCTIYVPLPSEYSKLRVEYVARYGVNPNASDIAMEQLILGHEVKHCFDGNYHQ